MRTKLVAMQFSLSTAEDERNYFSGTIQAIEPQQPEVLAAGTYRVINGVLCRIVTAAPPALDPASEHTRVTLRSKE